MTVSGLRNVQAHVGLCASGIQVLGGVCLLCIPDTCYAFYNSMVLPVKTGKRAKKQGQITGKKEGKAEADRDEMNEKVREYGHGV